MTADGLSWLVSCEVSSKRHFKEEIVGDTTDTCFSTKRNQVKITISYFCPTRTVTTFVKEDPYILVTGKWVKSFGQFL